MTIEEADKKAKYLLGPESKVEFDDSLGTLKCWIWHINNKWTQSAYCGRTWEEAFLELGKKTKSYNID